MVHNPIRYSEHVRHEDTDKAMESVTVSLFPDENAPMAVDFGGACPRCNGDQPTDRRWLVSVSPAARMNDKERRQFAKELTNLGIDLSRGDETFTLVCDCGQTHGGRPADKNGCGATYNVRVVWP